MSAGTWQAVVRARAVGGGAAVASLHAGAGGGGGGLNRRHLTSFCVCTYIIKYYSHG